jgi:thioester reductase-like protein
MQTGHPTADSFQISRYLCGRHIFLSGVTGFLGKLLLEKIIREMPEVGSVTVLVRAQDGTRAQKRFTDDVLGADLFTRLRREQAEHLDRFCREKIKVVSGDLTQDRLGLTAADFQALCRRIDLIVHAAATVRFNEDLERSLAVNALSIDRVTDLSRESGWSPVLHVSTCYVNGYHSGRIAECHRGPARNLPPALASRNPDGSFKVDALVRFLQARIANEKEKTADRGEQTARLIRLGIRTARQFGWNDTYTFTKWIGEQMIAGRMRGHSLAIVRPSIICSTQADPFPGWVEGIKVIDVLIMGYVLGKLKVYPALADATIDLIPADLVVNAVFIALADMLRIPDRKTIVQCASSATHPITVRELTRYCLAALAGPHRDIYDLVQKPVPAYPPLWTTRVPLRTLLRIRRAMLAVHKAVGRLRGDRFQKRLARKSRSLANAWNNLDVLSFYGRPDYAFDASTLEQLHAALAEGDRERFPVSAQGMDWATYLESHIGGLKEHVVKPSVQRRKAVEARSSKNAGARLPENASAAFAELNASSHWPASRKDCFSSPRYDNFYRKGS